MTTLTTGIYADFPIGDYIADPCPAPSLSTRIVQLLVERTPTHAYRDHPRLGGRTRKPSRAADFGSAAHACWLGGEDVVTVMIPQREKGKKPAAGAALVPADDFRTNDAKAARAEIEAAGKIPILAKERAKLDDMMAELAYYREAAGIVNGEPERTIVWEEYGVWFRVRPDYLLPEIRQVREYKTATNADAVSWWKTSAIPGGYDIKAALILRGLKAVTGEDWEFVFLAQETDEPYAVNSIGAGNSAIEFATQKIELAKERWRTCLERDEWPRYGYEIAWAEIPNYARFDFEARTAIQGAAQ